MSDGHSAPEVVLGVVGLGLIGGSIARRWRSLGGDVVGYARRTVTQDGARRAGVQPLDSVADVVAAADIVVLAVPLPALFEVLDRTALAVAEVPTPPTVTDVGSVKGPLTERAHRVLPDPSLFVGGHPMAGTEHQGWDASDRDLFEGAPWALALDPPVDLGRWIDVARVALALGAHVVPVTAAEHDEAVALTSHLPYVLAAALAGRVGGEPLAASLVGGSFRDATRVVRGGGGLGAEMAWANRDALTDRLDGLVADINGLRGAIDAGNEAAIRDVFARAGTRVSSLETAEIVPNADALLALGRQGGRVVGIVDEPSGAGAQAPAGGARLVVSGPGAPTP